MHPAFKAYSEIVVGFHRIDEKTFVAQVETRATRACSWERLMVRDMSPDLAEQLRGKIQ